MALPISPSNGMPSTDWIKLTAQTVHELARAIDMQARQSRKSYQQYGITENQGAILRLLLVDGPQSAIALSKRLYVTPSNMTGIIDRLETKGLINRTRQRDRRIMDIHLTDKGQQLIQNLPDPVEVKLRWAIEQSESQIPLPTLYAGLRSVLDHITSQSI
ncbi:MarR family transcriptional regulator [Desulfovermiculus halophilus]|uniref:MarR family transcriptional regulator n=1 Tax=Desulfovermiculus halophilus TaxID=339722 RepID=UPI000687666E|nr:MarR family transcriptional regulator [Desulfovermiculus halophilus]